MVVSPAHNSEAERMSEVRKRMFPPMMPGRI